MKKIVIMIRLNLLVRLVFSVILFFNFIHAQQQSRNRVVIVPFKNNVPNQARQNIINRIVDMCTAEFVAMKRHDVIERERLNDVLREQRLSLNDLFDQSTAARVGQLLGAELLITGAINNYSNIRVKGQQGWHFAAGISVTIRLIDVNTALIKDAFEAFGIGTNKNAKYAEQTAIRTLVLNIVTNYKKLNPISISIVKREGRFVYLNCGKNCGVFENYYFEVFNVGSSITSTSGKIFGREKKMCGIIKVTYTDYNYAKARIIKEKGRIKTGCIAQEVKAGVKFGITIGYSYISATGEKTLNVPEYAIIKEGTADTVIPDFSTYEVTPYLQGVYFGLNWLEMAYSPFSIHTHFSFTSSPKGLKSFQFEPSLSYDIRIIADRLYLPLGISFSVGRLKYEYDYTKELECVIREIDYNKASAKRYVENITFGFVVFGGIRVNIIDHIDIFARAGYRYHPINKMWDVKYTGKKDGKEVTQKFEVKENYLPFKDVDLRNLDGRVGVILH